MRRDDRELQQQYSAPERSPGLTWKHWAMIVAAIIVIIVVVSLIHLVAPFMGWWGPALANVAGGTLLVCIPAIPIGLVLHFWQENKRKNYKTRVHRPTSENAYPIIDLGGKFQEVANQIAPPVKVPQNQHYAPTIHQHNDVGHLLKLLERMQMQQQDAPALPGSQVQIPEAPEFRAMMHLISQTRMPLCYTADPGGRSAPAWGTVDDLLSMAIIGKPGRGKTTALMYYICILLKIGAEVWIWDPHGTMAPLTAISNCELEGMPETSRIVYLDSRDDVVNSVPVLAGILEERDEEYRAAMAQGVRYKTHPVLLLADELPVLADWDEQTKREYKALNAERKRRRLAEIEVPLLVDVMRRFVLEARKWRGFFIGSGQVIDHEILPTKVTDSLSSRIIFFSAERKARMAGLEKEAIEELLPVIRRAGSGVMVFDCARWDEPVIGAIPYIEPSDMVAMLGAAGGSGDQRLDIPQLKILPDIPARDGNARGAQGYPPQNDLDELSEPVPGTFGEVPETSPAGSFGGPSGDVPGGPPQVHKEMSPEQRRAFLAEYRKQMRLHGSADIKQCLRTCRMGNRYHRHASLLAQEVKEAQA